MSDAHRMTTYNPRLVTMALGNHVAAGFADDSFISVEPGTDGTSYVVGADGEIARSIDPARIYIVKASFLQNSATNDWLQKKFDRDSQKGDGFFSVNINDLLGGQKFVSGIAWVTKPATWGRGKQQGNREWEIVAADGEFK